MTDRILPDDKLLNLLQICDSGFPTGGFSHSLGLEAGLKCGVIKDRESLKQFICCCLENTGSFSLPFMREAFSSCHNVQSLCDLDTLYQACTSNHVTKRASQRQGTSMLNTCARVFDDNELECLVNSLPHKHQAVVFGAVCGALAVNEHACIVAFLYSSLRTAVASAIRLDRIGPIEAQSLQLEIQGYIPEVIKRYKTYTSADACMVHTHVDVIQNTHDTMFTKLFYS